MAGFASGWFACLQHSLLLVLFVLVKITMSHCMFWSPGKELWAAGSLGLWLD
jgi:hypothetical protein